MKSDAANGSGTASFAGHDAPEPPHNAGALNGKDPTGGAGMALPDALRQRHRRSAMCEGRARHTCRASCRTVGVSEASA
jgi:hypothetical protein